MGNNNSSGVNEEGAATAVQKKPSQKEPHGDDFDQGNVKTSMDESNDNMGTDAGLTFSEVQEPQKSSVSQLENALMVQSDQREEFIKRESEKSSMAAVELAETGIDISEALTVSSSKDIEDNEKPRELRLEKISLVTSDDQIDKEVTIKQEICEEIKMIQNHHDTFCNETRQKESKTNMTYAEKYKYLSYDSCKESESVVGTSIFIGISQENQAVEGKTAENQNQERRLSCVSNSENLNIYFQKQKTPSFDFDLRIKASPKEFDQTPLLNQNKTQADQNLSRQCDIVHLSLNSQAEYSQAQHQYTSASQGEKLVTSEKKYSVTSQATASKREKQVTASPSPPKAKEKHKHKSSPFSHFMCCATVIN